MALAMASHQTEEDYSSWLLPAVSEVLKKAGVRMAEVDAFGVASGPGSFTGSRIGLTTVKAWGEVYGRPIVAVSSIGVASHGKPGAGRNTWRHGRTRRRGQVFGAVYRRRENSLERIGDEMVMEPGKFVEKVAELVGERGSRGLRAMWIACSSKRMERRDKS